MHLICGLGFFHSRDVPPTFRNVDTQQIAFVRSTQLIGPSVCIKHDRASEIETQRTDVAHQRHEKSGAASATFPGDGLGGSSKSVEEINDALHEYSSSFDQTRILERRVMRAEEGGGYFALPAMDSGSSCLGPGQKGKSGLDYQGWQRRIHHGVRRGTSS